MYGTNGGSHRLGVSNAAMCRFADKRLLFIDKVDTGMFLCGFAVKLASDGKV